MNPLPNKSITLVELIVAISLFAVLVLAFLSIDRFSDYHLRNTDIRAVVQNEAAFVLEHMSKQIAQAIGNPNIIGQEPVAMHSISGDWAIKVWIDGNNDGVRDRRVAYRWTEASGSLDDRYQIWYYADCPGSVCPDPPEIIARGIVAFSCAAVDNYVTIQVQACHIPCKQPANTCNCSATNPDNPLIEMATSIKMLGVSLN